MFRDYENVRNDQKYSLCLKSFCNCLSDRFVAVIIDGGDNYDSMYTPSTFIKQEQIVY